LLGTFDGGISADLARCSHLGTGRIGFELAGAVAAVPGDGVAIVALFGGLLETVAAALTTSAWGHAGERGVDGAAIGTATIRGSGATEGIAVVAHFVGLNDSIAATSARSPLDGATPSCFNETAIVSAAVAAYVIAVVTYFERRLDDAVAAPDAWTAGSRALVI
jgi:hypothetical protein